jgi:hypothetical protein
METPFWARPCVRLQKAASSAAGADECAPAGDLRDHPAVFASTAATARPTPGRSVTTASDGGRRFQPVQQPYSTGRSSCGRLIGPLVTEIDDDGADEPSDRRRTAAPAQHFSAAFTPATSPRAAAPRSRWSRRTAPRRKAGDVLEFQCGSSAVGVHAVVLDGVGRTSHPLAPATRRCAHPELHLLRHGGGEPRM